MIVTDLFESTPAPSGTNPYGYQVGQTVKLQNGSQGQVVDIFDDSIEVLLPRGNTMTVDFRDAEVLDEYSITESRQVFTESRHNKLLKEDATYRKFHNLSRMLAERKMTEKEILDLFAAVEQGANATGQNRTMLGKGKDVAAGAYTSVKDAISGVLNSIQKSTPVAGVDAAYNDATGALRDAVGTNSKVMDSIKKYRLLAKEYPKTQLFVKTALIALAGLATGGAGLPAIAGLTMAVDAAIKGEKLSSIIGKGAGAALMAYGAQEVQSMLSGGAAPADAIGMPAGGDQLAAAPTELGSYTVQAGDTLSQIAQANDISVQELIGLNPQLAADAGAVGGQNLNPDVIFPGQEITLPPASGADVYAGGVGTSADTMANIAKGNIPDSSISQAASLERLGQAAPSGAGPAAAPTGPTNLAPNFDPANVPQGMTIKYAPPPVSGAVSGAVSGVEIAGMPVVAGQPLNATQMAVANMAMRSGNVLDPVVQAAYDLAKRGAVRESVKLIKLPAEQLIDQKLTVMAWALNESVGKPPARNMHLTRRGVLTVIENVDRHRRALLKELAAGPDRTNIPAVRRADMPLAPQDGVVKPGMIGKGLNWLDKATSKVGGYLSKQAQNFTRKVTAAKLKTEWEQEGHQTDSDYIAAFLTKQGVPQDVVTDVYGKMGIPYTAPVAAPVDGAATPVDGAAAPVAAPVGGAQRQAYAGIDPVTKKPYTGDQLRNKFFPTTPAAPTAPTTATTTPAAPTTAAGKFPGEDPQGAGYVGRREVARRQAARDAEAAKKPATPNFGQQTAGYKSVNYAPNIKTGASLPKPAAAPTKTPTQAEKDAYVKSIGAPAMAETRIAAALKRPVAEMLQMVETKEDVAKIKQFVDQTFVKYGAANESAFVVRNQILEHVTQVGAQRRREHARMS